MADSRSEEAPLGGRPIGRETTEYVPTDPPTKSRDIIEFQFYESLLRKERIGPAAARLGISYKTGYRLARKLEALGALRRDALRWPNEYLRGPNADPWDVALARWRAGKVPRPPGGPPEYAMECRVHGGSLRCEITDTTKAPPPATRTDYQGWIKTWNAGPKGEVPHAQLDIELSGIRVGVQFIGATKPSVILYPPPMTARSPKELLDIIHRVIPDFAREAIRQLAKTFGVGFSNTVSWNQPPEFAFPDTNGILALSREAYFRIYGNRGAWTDASEGPMEYETRSLDLAFLAFSIPSLLRSGHLQWVDHPEDSRDDNPDSEEGKDSSEPALSTVTSNSVTL